MQLRTEGSSLITDEMRKIRLSAVIVAALWTLLLSGLFVADSLLTLHNESIHDVFIYSIIWMLGLGFLWYATQKIVLTMTSLNNERDSLRKSKEELRKNKRQLKDIIEFLPDATLAIDNDKRVIIWNRAIEEMTGVPAAEMIGKGDYAYTIPFYGEARPQLMDLVFEDREEIAARYPNITWKGDTLTTEVFCQALHNNKGAWVFAKASPLHDQFGAVIGAIESIRDITEHKRVEEGLISSLSVVNATLESTADGILVVDMDRRITRWNQKFIDLFQIPEELLNTDVKIPVLNHIASQMIQPDEFKAKAMELYDTPELTSSDMLYLLDGRVLRRFSQPQKNGDDIVGRVWSFHDITDIKQAEEELRVLEHQFHQAQKMESLGVLAGGIAHDFNNILTIILGHCYMAREDMLSGEELVTAFKQIESAGNRAADLCRQMLAYAGKSSMEQTRVDLWLLIDEVVKMLQAAIKKNVTITLDLNCDVPEINGDTGQLQQVVMNLITNAVEAIGEANGTIRVVLTHVVTNADQTGTDTFGGVILPGTYACLEVTDTGCGMEVETQKRIFEPFYTTKFSGRGLGMAAVQGIIKAHEALLFLTSAPGGGTSFKIYFPVTFAVPGFVETASAVSALPEKASGMILLVEDEQVLRSIGTSLLESMGLTVLSAQHGSEALEIYRERGGDIDLILLDLIMPVMDGVETYHELRKIAPTIPVIICSGYGIESIQDVIDTDLHTRFVHKPYKPVELQNMVAKMLKGEDYPELRLMGGGPGLGQYPYEEV
jgi:two-component system, cell cycle sensor histidine kinase and response regulator CckA